MHVISNILTAVCLRFSALIVQTTIGVNHMEIGIEMFEWKPTFYAIVRQRETQVESSWNVMAHGDARVVKWRGNWRIESVASTPHTTSEHGVSGNTTADAHTSAASSRMNWRPPPI